MDEFMRHGLAECIDGQNKGATMFQRATKKQAKARIGLIGPAGSGKTMTALRLAQSLGQRIALLDTEHGSASKYADQFEFDAMLLANFDPRNYIEAIKAAQEDGYDVLIIDSLSHAWTGTGGVLEIVDAVTAKSKSGNAFSSGWRQASPLHNQLIEAILQANLHIIGTMRSKTEYVVEKDSHGKAIPRKVGMAPVQRDGMEYEFDVVGELDWDHNLVVTKTRCSGLDGKLFNRPGKEMGDILGAWLNDGVVTADTTSAPKKEPDSLPPGWKQFTDACDALAATDLNGWKLKPADYKSIGNAVQTVLAKDVVVGPTTNDRCIQAAKWVKEHGALRLLENKDSGEVFGVEVYTRRPAA